jgi:hypothetical protein
VLAPFAVLLGQGGFVEGAPDRGPDLTFLEEP